LLFGITLFISANTLKLVFYQRKEEIEILRLMGASEEFHKDSFYPRRGLSRGFRSDSFFGPFLFDLRIPPQQNTHMGATLFTRTKVSFP